MAERAIDVFELYQGNVDWGAVARSGVKHALIKLTNGAAVAGPPGDHYVTGARNAGLRVGGYHYALGGNPIDQANVFAAELYRLQALDDAPELDYEDPSLPLDEAGGQAWILAFFGQLRAQIPGLSTVLLYSSGSELTRLNAGAISVPGLTILIWDAEYGVNDGAEHPVRYYTGPIAVHQYTSVGSVPGIAGSVDLDTVTTDISEEQDMPLTDADAQLVAKHVWYDWIWSWKNSDGSEGGMNPSQVLQQLNTENTALAAQVTALGTAVAKIALDPAVTPDQIKLWLDDAVSQHIAVTGTVQIGPVATPPPATT